MKLRPQIAPSILASSVLLWSAFAQHTATAPRAKPAAAPAAKPATAPAAKAVPAPPTEITLKPATQVGPEGNLFLRFSRDGALLHVIGPVNLGDDTQKTAHVRSVTFSANTGLVLHNINLPPDSSVYAVTTDGSHAIVSTDASTPHLHLFLVDTATGQRQPIPDAWYDPTGDPGPELSGDGKLLSIYTETESATPMTVKVYDWATKALVATRTSEYIAAGGGMGGGVTPDGQVEFDNNRVGSKIVDLKTGRTLAQFGPSSVRSPDGVWEVMPPNLNFDESAPKDVLLKDGATGKVIGKLDYTPAENELDGELTGTFCGTSGRFILFGGGTIAAFALPSGSRLEDIASTSWRDPGGSGYPTVACSVDGKRVAILDGTRLTLHKLK